ncbi:MAG: hypothetical protein PSV40_15720 [Polaromonas sp.]|uniref:hypothetical protein n=1 Tax=Polaromonas sp. TaxID=1869339 RepID=UPI0024898DA5|nr:hypothetical protein [Polaromonas sp.]MDI1270536.1 hypothetical protein [Polaromonas sp.]
MNNQETMQPILVDEHHGMPGSFFPARIMDPSEVQHATLGRPSAVQAWTNGKWYVCGDVRSKLFEMLNAEHRDASAVRLTAFNSPAGGSYAVLSHQILGLAHRFLLPLYEPKVEELLLGLQRAELSMLFGNEGKDDAVLLHCPLSALAFAPLLAMTTPLPKETLHDVIAELPMVISAVNQPKQVPSLRRGEFVTDVSVSVVMPSRALTRFFSEKRGG